MKISSVDLTDMNANIDSLLDVYINTQKEHGIDVGMVECDVSIDVDGRIIKEKKKDVEKKETVEHKCHGECHSKCTAKEKECDTIPWYFKNTMGLFGEDASDELEEEDDGDDKYICEYCTEVGYRKEYKSYICDTCTSCETCAEYTSGDCDGCTYSMYRTGELYSLTLAKNGDDSYLVEDERKLIKDIQEGRYDDFGIRKPDLSFTIMDYDHSY